MGKDSNTFCILPWVHSTHNQSGNFRLCCQASQHPLKDTTDSVQWNWGNSSLSDYWNSKAMKDIRLKMLSGEKLSQCTKCYIAEDAGKSSFRQYQNDMWDNGEFDEIIESSTKDGTVDELPVYFDLKLSNLCNLKCRMCEGTASSEIHKETLQLQQEFPEEVEKYPKLSTTRVKPGNNSAWVDNPRVWDELRDRLPYIRRIEATGGEPTLIQPLHDILHECVDKGYASNIGLSVITNLTNTKESFTDVIQKFKSTWLNGSTDGVGKVQEYIRFPSKWESIKKNMLKYANLEETLGTDKFGFSLICTVQLYNILYIDEFIIFLLENNMRMNLSYLNQPDFLSTAILPVELRDIAIAKLENILKNKYSMEETHFHTYTENVRHIESLIRYLKNNVADDSQILVNKFLSYTAMLDKKRNQSYFDTFPEMEIMKHGT